MKFVTLKKAYKGQPIGARISVDDDDADTLVKAEVAEIVTDNPLPELFAKAMEGQFAKLDAAISKSLEELLKRFDAASRKSRKNGVPEMLGQDDVNPDHSFGKFLLAIRTGDMKALEEMGAQFVEWEGKAAMNTNTGGEGGFLVPSQHYERIMDVVSENAIVRPRATVLPMSGRQVEIPYLDITGAVPTNGSAFFGGLVGQWTEEGTTLNQTEPNFRQAELRNYELSGYSKVSNSLNQDAPGLEAFLFKLFGQAVAWHEDFAFLRGNGVGKPLGAQTWVGFIAATRSAASAFGLTDIGSVMSRWFGSYNPRTCCWVAHPGLLKVLIPMADTAGNAVFINKAGDRISWNLAGLTLEITEKVPTLNTAGDIGLYDFEKYIIGDRKQMEIAYSDHAGFTTNQRFWRFVTRVGGMPWLRTNITLADGSHTVSPFVGLAAG